MCLLSAETGGLRPRSLGQCGQYTGMLSQKEGLRALERNVVGGESRPGVVVHSFNLSTWKREAGVYL